MECKNCGYKLRKNQSVCPRCGYSFDYKKEEKEKRAGLAVASVGAVGLSASLLSKIRNITNGTDANLNVNAAEINSTDSLSKESILTDSFFDNKMSTDEFLNQSFIGANDTFSGDLNIGKGSTHIETANVDINEKINDILNLYNISIDDPLSISEPTSGTAVGSTGGTNTKPSTPSTSSQATTSQSGGGSTTGDHLSFESGTTSDVYPSTYTFNEDDFRTTLSTYGLDESEINRVVEAAKTGGNESANQVLGEIYSQHYEEYQNKLIEQLQNGVSEDVINSVQNNPSNQNVDSINIGEFNEADMRASLSNQGLNESEINRVVEAAKTGNQETYNQVISEINSERAQQYENNLTSQLKENGFSDEEVAKIVDAYKTGDQEKVNQTMSDISSSRSLAAEQEMRQNLTQNGLTEEEVNKVIEAYKTGDQTQVENVYNEINAARLEQNEQSMREYLSSNGLS